MPWPMESTNGLMAAADKKTMNRLIGVNTVTTLANLPISKEYHSYVISRYHPIRAVRDADRGGADDQVRPVGGLHAGYTQLRGLCKHEWYFYNHYG